jgi:hypothetical protein
LWNLCTNHSLHWLIVKSYRGVSSLPRLCYVSLAIMTLSSCSWCYDLMLTVQNRAQVHRKPTGDLVPFSPRRVLPRFVNPRMGSKLLGFSI